MDDSRDMTGKAAWAQPLLRVLRVAAPAVIGAAALTFLFAAVMPIGWVAGIGWNLYLDRLSDLFVPPIGNGGRLALALGMAAIAAVIAGIVALVIAKPEASGFSSLRRRLRRGDAEAEAEADEQEIRPRRRVDLHPDDPPRPPIRAGRDLPAEGLGPLNALAPAMAAGEDDEFDLSFADLAEEEPVAVNPVAQDEDEDEDELVLAELAPEPTGDEPWLQPADFAGPAMPDPADNSLGAMVARLEAGLARRQVPIEPAAASSITAPAVQDVQPEVDFALEAALSTLQRMTRQAVG